jgi:hypothetical protein
MQGRVRPSKGVSAIGVAVGIFMLVIGLTTVGTAGGAFMIFWIFAVLAITGFYAYNLISERGAAFTVIDVDTRQAQPPSPPRSTQERLSELDLLRQQGMVTDQEYQEKRRQILGDL